MKQKSSARGILVAFIYFSSVLAADADGRMNPPIRQAKESKILCRKRRISSERIGDRMFPWAVSSRSLSKTIWLVKLVVYVTGPDPFGRSGRGGWFLPARAWYKSL